MNGVITNVMYYIGQYQLGRENILDPLSTIIKLAILGYKTDMSKIAIRYNSIYIHETCFYQPAIRYLYGDTKDYLHYLKEPILIACTQYLKDPITSSPSFYKNTDSVKIDLLFRLALKGLNKLKITYQTHKIILCCLEHYELIISSHLDKTDIRESFKTDAMREEYSDKMVDSLLDFWNNDNMNIVINLFDNLERNKDYNLIKVIETFMSSVDTSINHIVINSC